MGGVSGAGGTGGAAGSGGLGISLTREWPIEYVHTAIGHVEASSCFTSLTPTIMGVMLAGTRGDRPFSARGAGDAASGWTWTKGATPEARGAAFVFGDDSGYVLAWSTSNSAELAVELHEPDGRLIRSLTWPVPGDPVAGLGAPSGFTLALSDANQLSLLRSDGDDFSVVPVEAESCVEPSSVALGRFEDDVVAAYYCNRFAHDDTPEYQHLVVARVSAVSGEVEKTVLDVEVGETRNGDVSAGMPATAWVDGELLFAHGTSVYGQLALTRVGDDLVPRTELVTGVPDVYVNAGDSGPVFSVAQVGDQVALVRSACNGHEDAGPTGSVTLCNVSASTLEATCLDVEAPCSAVKVVANGSDVTLLGCPRNGAAAVVPLELTSPPTPGEAQFPAGYSELTPLALSCAGGGCSALAVLNAAEMTTGYDRRVAQVDVTFPARCNNGPGAACTASTTVTLTDVVTATHIRGSSSSNLGVERQPTGFPFALTTVLRDGIQTIPTLWVLDRGGSVHWTEPLVDHDAPLFKEGEGYRGFGAQVTTTMLIQFTATATGVADEPALLVGRPGLPPSIAQCDGRYFVHGTTVPSSSIELAKPAIYTFGPQDPAPTLLFELDVAPQVSGQPPPALACAGTRLFLLEGLVLHRYLESGEREPDIAVATAPPTGSGPGNVLARLETHRDYALALGVNTAANAIDALFLYADGTTRLFELSVRPEMLPLSNLMSAPELVDGWLNLLYQSARVDAPSLGSGASFNSAYKLPL